jgi:hypothetical protein
MLDSNRDHKPATDCRPRSRVTPIDPQVDRAVSRRKPEENRPVPKWSGLFFAKIEESGRGGAARLRPIEDQVPLVEKP